jgi:hypothetical protein
LHRARGPIIEALGFGIILRHRVIGHKAQLTSPATLKAELEAPSLPRSEGSQRIHQEQSGTETCRLSHDCNVRMIPCRRQQKNRGHRQNGTGSSSRDCSGARNQVLDCMVRADHTVISGHSGPENIPTASASSISGLPSAGRSEVPSPCRWHSQTPSRHSGSANKRPRPRTRFPRGGKM